MWGDSSALWCVSLECCNCGLTTCYLDEDTGCYVLEEAHEEKNRWSWLSRWRVRYDRMNCQRWHDVLISEKRSKFVDRACSSHEIHLLVCCTLREKLRRSRNNHQADTLAKLPEKRVLIGGGSIPSFTQLNGLPKKESLVPFRISSASMCAHAYMNDSIGGKWIVGGVLSGVSVSLSEPPEASSTALERGDSSGREFIGSDAIVRGLSSSSSLRINLIVDFTLGMAESKNSAGEGDNPKAFTFAPFWEVGREIILSGGARMVFGPGMKQSSGRLRVRGLWVGKPKTSYASGPSAVWIAAE